MSAFLLPNGKLFYGGTYFPPADREVQGGVMPGFPRILESVLTAFNTKREEIEKQADSLSNYLRHQATAVILNPAEISKTLIAEAAAAIAKHVDHEHGGFGNPPYAPKFPQPAMGIFLLEYAAANQDNAALKPVVHQATAMARGGIYDQVGGGFHRYSVDRKWVVPHFEKMLYDQAQILSLYSKLHQQQPNDEFERAIRETVEFLKREMMSPENLFYSALDADTEHEEGKYYIWSTDELRRLLGDDFGWFAKFFGVNQGPNFEGKHILVRTETVSDAAHRLGVSEPQFLEMLNRAKQTLLAAREQRIKPLLDTKVITSWNGLTIVGLADAAQALGDADFRELALASANQMLAKLRKADATLYRHWIAGEGKGDGYAEDYAATALAMLAAHRLQNDEKYLNAAKQFLDYLLDNFWDARGNGFFYTGKSQESLIAPLKDNYDGAMPSANSMASLALVQFAKQSGQDSYREKAMETFEAFANSLNGSPGSSPLMMCALGAYYQTSTTAAASTPADPDAPIRSIEWKPEKLQVSAGQTTEVTLRIQLNEPWHINANPASPSYLKPTLLTMKDNAVIEKFEVKYPKAESLKTAGFDEPLAVYQGTVELKISLAVAANAKAGEHPIAVELQYQPCDDQRCLAPARKKLTLNVEVTR